MDTSAKAHFAFVGLDETSKYKPDKIVVKNELAHDGPKSNQIKFPDDAGDILKISSSDKNTFIAVFKNRIYICDALNLQVSQEIMTRVNPFGLHSIQSCCEDQDTHIIAFLSAAQGNVSVLELKENSLRFKDSQIKNFICHSGEIDNFTLS